MNEYSKFQDLVIRIKEDKKFRTRNISEAVKLIPLIGGFIEANTLGKDFDEKLEQRLLVLERMAIKALEQEDIIDILNTLEQHTLILNRFLFENQDVLNINTKDAKQHLEKVKVGLSFVEQDYDLVLKIAKQLKDNQIEVISNNVQLVVELKLQFNKELTFDTESLVVIYSKNYEKYNSSSYKGQTLFNYAKTNKISIFTFAFDEITDSKIIEENTFQKIFKRDEVQDIISTFFFDKFKESKEIEQVFFKKYANVEKVLKLYHSGFYKVHESEKNNIGFELYKLKQLTGRSVFCLYLYENINYKRTIEYVRNLYPDLNIFTELFVLLNRSRKNIAYKRKERIKSLIEVDSKIYFLDEFIWQELTSEYFKENNNLKSVTYVEPFFLNMGEKFDNFNFFNNWLYKYNSPTLIITGSGGIGKTAFAYELTKKINSAQDNTSAIYIDARGISSTLLHLSHNDNIDLYSFYEASVQKSTDKNKIDYDLFRINVDNGNIVIIIDGLDEIISRLGDLFDVREFFNSIQSFSDGIGNGKVVLTSRNYFWNKSKSADFNIQTIEILPFDKNKAEEFFNKRYPNSSKIVNRAMSISESILGMNSQEYIPYVLECVAFMIDDAVENDDYYDPDFDSDILRQDIKNDFILGKLCVREGERLEQVSVDNQVKLFFEIALNNLSVKEFKSSCKRVVLDEINDRQIEAFLSHPIIDLKGNNVSFRYDFFKNHIKNIYISLLLNGLSKLNNHHIDILTNNISYSSSFLIEICIRITLKYEKFEFRILELIDSIKNNGDINNDIKIRSISSLFIIILKYAHFKTTNDIITNTNVFKQIFEVSKNNVTDFFFVDLSCNDNSKIIFDFSDLTISNAYIKSYDYFWHCRFNENTKFTDPYLYNLYCEKRLNTTARPKNFINIKGSDNTVLKIIKKTNLKIESIDSSIINDLHQFFSCFCSNGIIENRLLPKIKRKYHRYAIDLSDLIKILCKEKVITVYKHSRGNETIKINPTYNNDILKFYSNRLSIGIIKQIFVKAKEKLGKI